ncbi:MAG: hypothetical protein IPM97_03690 [Bdellovibrionaceae bacterium]|nr:hypothetical protein [Pseudobdellovibrionaceae bacterium]
MKTEKTLNAALLLTLLSLLTACAAQTNSSDSFASRAAPTTTTSASTQPLAYCNQKSHEGLSVNLMVYVDSANNIRNDYMKVKITQIPSDFATGSYLEFFRWQANSNGQTYLDPTPTQARFETLSGQILTNFSPVIYWGQISQIAKNSGYSDPNQFLQYVRLVVDIRDPQAQYDVLKVAFYNSSNVATIDMDLLLPAFAASPSDYQNDRGTVRPAALQNLHPFAAKTSEGWTGAQFQSMANGYCF